MKKMIYMDHAATTELLPEARAAMEPFLRNEYGNASTSYDLGRRARRALEQARAVVAEAIGAQPEEIYFTSGGSESDNWALRGIAEMHKEGGTRIITSEIEHHAVLHSCDYLEKMGCRVAYLPVDRRGVVSTERLTELLEAESVNLHTTLVSVMYANNEIGTIEPIDELGRIARKHGALFHTDAVQAIGQIPVSVQQSPIDCLSASGHKFHGPKGVGFLYVRSGIAIPSLIHGGGQERGRRAGTENVAGIVGMAEALRVAVRDRKVNSARITYLREDLVRRVMREIPDVLYNGHPIDRLPGSASFSFRGVNATALLVLLEEAGICASAASACTAGTTEVSHVIREIGVPQEYAAGTIRLTLGRENTPAEVAYCVQTLKRSVQLLRSDG